MNDNYIQMKLHDVERAFYDRRADWLTAVGLDAELPISMAVRQKMLHEAEAIFQRARAFVPRRGNANVRSAVIDVLRRMGGKP